jgi:hypothetical protein
VWLPCFIIVCSRLWYVECGGLQWTGKHYKMGPMYSVECDLPSSNGKSCESTSFDENWCMCKVDGKTHDILEDFGWKRRANCFQISIYKDKWSCYSFDWICMHCALRLRMRMKWMFINNPLLLCSKFFKKTLLHGKDQDNM